PHDREGIRRGNQQRPLVEGETAAAQECIQTGARAPAQKRLTPVCRGVRYAWWLRPDEEPTKLNRQRLKSPLFSHGGQFRVDKPQGILCRQRVQVTSCGRRKRRCHAVTLRRRTTVSCHACWPERGSG